jgi:hypothetical protein
VVTLNDGMCHISNPDGSLYLTALATEAGTPLHLAEPPSPDSGAKQIWQVRRTNNGTYTICDDDTELYVGFDGDPDPNELARGYFHPREWQLTDFENEDGVDYAEIQGSLLIRVPSTNLRLADDHHRLHQSYPRFVTPIPHTEPYDETWNFHFLGPLE